MDSKKGLAERETPARLARRLNLPFSKHQLLQRALTHRSYLNENSDALEDNERLEFLGDAVLDFLVAAWLYNRYPEMSEGDLTRMRAALVGTDQLANFSQHLNVGPAILLGRGEDDGGGRSRPALLCATFEAIIGALYLDAGIAAVQKFMEPLLAPVAENILIQRKDKDAKSRLQEWAQAKGYPVPDYRLISTSGPEHARIFVIEVFVNGDPCGRGEATSKHAASMKAAVNALHTLGLE